MKRKIFCFFIIAIGIVNCNSRSKSYLEDVVLIPKGSICEVLNSFVKENGNSTIYELYIDKQTPHDFILTLYCGESSLTEDENIYNSQTPLNYTIVSGKRFDIFSGVERYFNEKKDVIKNAIQSKNQIESIWIVKDSFNIISIYKDVEYVYPFVPLAARFTESTFSPPIIDSDKKD